MLKNYMKRALLLAAALPLAMTSLAQDKTTVAYWSFNYAYTVNNGVGTPNTTAVTSNGGTNLNGYKLKANEQFAEGDNTLTAVRNTRAGQVAAQDDKGAYHEVNAINCDGAALHMTSPVPTPKEPSANWTWGDNSEPWPDGGTYSYQNPYNYFELELNTQAYKENIELEVKAAGHNSETQYYAIAYSLDKQTWTIVGDEYLTGSSYNRWVNTTVNLPIGKQAAAYVRIFPAHNWKAGNSVNQDNQFDLDDVWVRGELDANVADISSITVSGGYALEESSVKSFDYDVRLPNSYTDGTVTFTVASTNGTLKATAYWDAEEEDITVKDNGDGTFTVPVPPSDNYYEVTFTIQPDEGAIVKRQKVKIYLFHAGPARITSLTVDGEAVPTALRTTLNGGDNTATLTGSIYTTLPVVEAKINDGVAPEITSTVQNGVATFLIKATERTFTLNIEGVHLYEMGDKDELVTLNYTTSGFTAPGTWTDGLYTLETSSLDGWNGSQFKFNAADHKLSIPAGVVIKQFTFSRFSANYGNGEGVTSFTSEGANCYVPSKHNYTRGVNTNVSVILENHQPGAPVEFTLTGGNQPYASFELIIEKTDPKIAPVLRDASSVANNNHAVVTFVFDREMATTEATINGQTVKAPGGTTTLSFPVYELDYNKTYTLTIAAGAAKDLFGNSNAEPITFDVTIGDKPVAVKAAYDYIVSTAQEFRDAVSGVNNTNKTEDADRKVIFVKNGLYDFGSTEVRLNAFNVSVIGESRDGVTLTGVRNGISNPIINLRGDQGVRATGYYLQDLTLQNDFNFRSADYNTGQAVAVYGGNKTIMKNVRMHGNQDTQVTGERSYFDRCEIHGTVDFICGGGDNFYDHCDLVLENRGGNVIAAPNTSPDLKWGYVFSNCTIKADSTEYLNGRKSKIDVVDGSYNLGRPWQAYPRIAYVNTRMLVLPDNNGWTSMGNLPTSFYEYGSVDKDGNLLDLSVRGNSPTSTNTYVPILTAEQAEQYTVGNVLSSTDGWLPTDYTTLPAAPQATVNADKLITWNADSEVRCYVIFKDGQYLTNTTDTQYQATEDGLYVIRPTNSMGGMSTEGARVGIGVDAISAILSDTQSAPAYSLSGQQVTKAYKGIVVKQGKKYVVK